MFVSEIMIELKFEEFEFLLKNSKKFESGRRNEFDPFKWYICVHNILESGKHSQG